MTQAEAVTELRAAYGYSPGAFAVALGIRPSWIRDYEAGRRLVPGPSLWRMRLLAERLKRLDLQDAFDRAREDNEKPWSCFK
jgi:DNA-binding transcriptional regulator YiaG